MHDHDHSHEPASGESPSLDRNLSVSIGLNALIVVVEAAGGLLSGSLALLSDALHNLDDVVALALALIARKLGRRPNSPKHTYGLGRLEVLKSLTGVLLLGWSAATCFTVVSRFFDIRIRRWLTKDGQNDMKTSKNERGNPRQMDVQNPGIEDVSGRTSGPAFHNYSGTHGCILPVPITNP
jgi:hypothetical protein